MTKFKIPNRNVFLVGLCRLVFIALLVGLKPLSVCPQSISQKTSSNESIVKSVDSVLVTQSEIKEGSISFREIDSKGQFIFQMNDQSVSIPADQMVWWNGRPVEIVQDWIVLTDGSVIAGQFQKLDSSEALIGSVIWKSLTVRRENVRAILLHAPAGESELNQLLNVIQERSRSGSDRIWLTDGDMVEGAIGELSGDSKLELVTSDGSIQISLEQIAALDFANGNKNGDQTDSSTDANELEVCFKDGSRLNLELPQASESILHDVVRFQVGEQILQLQPSSDIDCRAMVCGLVNNRFKDSFLHPKQIENWQHHPILGPKIDITQMPMTFNVWQNRFVDDWRWYPFGIGMPTRSSFVVRLASEARVFQFGLIMDKSSGDRGSVECVVLGLTADREWKTLFSSQVIRGDDPVGFHSIELDGIQAIALAADYADGNDVLDRVNWIMPRIVQ